MSEQKSQVRVNAERDPAYCPYCLRCPGLRRMQQVERYLWRCHCRAVHDERQLGDVVRPAFPPRPDKPWVEMDYRELPLPPVARGDAMTEQDQTAVDELMLKHYGARRAAITTNKQWHRTGGDDGQLAGKGCWVCAYANVYPEDPGREPALYLVHWSNFFGKPATVVYRALPRTEQPARA